MTQIDFQHACDYARHRLVHETPASHVYHSLWHTESEVLPSVIELAALEGVAGEDVLLLQTAAWYHDLGCVVQHQDHEAIGIGIASAMLPQFGYAPEQVAVVRRAIWATRLPQAPGDLLGRILADSDLVVLGCADFPERNRQLRSELATLGQTFSDREWCRAQLRFLREHSYFTASARHLRAAQKQRNLEHLEALLAEATYTEEG